MTHENTDRYIDALPFLVHTYNNRKHRMIGMSPIEAELPGWTYHIRRNRNCIIQKLKEKTEIQHRSNRMYQHNEGKI